MLSSLVCSIVVSCSLLESTIVPHQSALYGYHATKAVVLEWCSVLMYSGSHSGWVVGWCVAIGVGSIIDVGSGECGGRNVMCKLKGEIACT